MREIIRVRFTDAQIFNEIFTMIRIDLFPQSSLRPISPCNSRTLVEIRELRENCCLLRFVEVPHLSSRYKKFGTVIVVLDVVSCKFRWYSISRILPAALSSISRARCYCRCFSRSRMISFFLSLFRCALFFSISRSRSRELTCSLLDFLF